MTHMQCTQWWCILHLRYQIEELHPDVGGYQVQPFISGWLPGATILLSYEDFSLRTAT